MTVGLPSYAVNYEIKRLPSAKEMAQWFKFSENTVEFRQLKYFCAIADSGSISRAAQQVYIAQSALSKQIAELEAELQVLLLHRSRSGVTLTEEGKIFYEYALAIQKQINDARAAVGHASGAVVGHVVLAIPQSISSTLALPLIKAAQERLPHIQLHINEELSGNLLELLRQGRVDMGLFTPNIPLADFNFTALIKEDFALIHAVNYPQAPAAGDISLSKAAKHPLLMPGPQHGQCTRVFVEQALQRKGFEALTISTEINSVHILKSAVEAGVGASIMPLGLAAQEVAQGRLVAHRISRSGLQRQLGLCASKHIPMTHAKRAVSALVADVARGLCTGGQWPGAARLPEL
jgi:LysR family transcriptional regulator, nitrogen assimilation regulatory protein